ncbi:low molecular weight protein arginine phosphatase [Aneurinibacillus sp. Ricciae_BoGa-3]|uniref:low molecular weight protein arginine phosphatase n=1 Tax=Aneurinibacillus sp. Ricciae_BoGa-3 TaxID=3022697 RepID=UPI0023423B43|nr:low molecular weight protein arginine phosphatase [Aneurinibacillus sp. Ricciae_BoGa-3]WCK54359.1 low molecular weight protein arginine phosphatase [Aneurinibacillus sp. Ricciae_BoGa-3]
MRILFVCTGNTCRSPMAEKLLRKMAAERGMDIEVKSAGLFASPGSAASPQAVHVLGKRGITESHQSQPATSELLDWADLILTMTESHRDSLLQKYEHLQSKIYTLKEYTDISLEELSRGEELDSLYQEVERKQEAFLNSHREEIRRLEDEYQELYNRLEVVREELDEWKNRLMKETTEERNRIAILEQQVPGYDIVDPYGGTVEDYETCAGEIEQALHNLLKILKKNTENS